MKLFSSTRTDAGSFTFALVEAATLKEADKIFDAYLMGSDKTRKALEPKLFDAITGFCFTEL